MFGEQRCASERSPHAIAAKRLSPSLVPAYMFAAMLHAASPAATTPLPAGTLIPVDSLRAEMEARRAANDPFSIREALGILVPLCTRLAELHAAGKTLFVTPSSLRRTDMGLEIVDSLAHAAPSFPRDRACLAPETRRGEPGDARASVFMVGALLYELLTSASVGPGMQRPTELVANLPPALESLLGKSLVADPKHRPGDLSALAQALHSVAPMASIAPPSADVSRLDHGDDFDVDVSLSMLPPPPEPNGAGLIPRAPMLPKNLAAIQGDGPFGVAIRKDDPSSSRRADPTQALSELKARLEADPRPRYVVVKGGMDHGPFSAVELLQQIASGSFTGDHALRDTYSSEERFIKEWDEFAPFATHTKLNREIVQERRDLEAVVVKEKQGSQTKALIGAALVGILVAGFLGLWLRERRSREKELVVHGDTAMTVDVDAGLGAGAKARPGGGGRAVGGPAPGGGSYPVLSGGGSCEAAQARYVEEYKLGGGNGPPDLTAGAYGAVLNKGSYLNACGVPSTMSVSVCAAVQNGRAIGVTVTTSPSNPGIASCVAGQVRGLPFPSHPRLDVARTTFSAN
jgi:hypothetical protein